MKTKEDVIRRVIHSGPVRFGDVECEAVVLDNGARGFIQRQMMKAVGFSEKKQSSRFLIFLAELSPKALIIMQNTGCQVVNPGHGNANFVSYEIVPEICDAVIDAALDGVLHPQRRHLIAPCRKIQAALSRVGIVALIDEATGYQYRRESSALQDLFAKLIREHVSDWQRRFSPDFYEAIFALYGWKYQGHAHGIPAIVGKITLRYVYEAIFPAAIVAEIKARQKSERLHQWLTNEGGLPLLEKQINALIVIAKTSFSPDDFFARCEAVFFRRGLQTGIGFS